MRVLLLLLVLSAACASSNPREERADVARADVEKSAPDVSRVDGGEAMSSRSLCAFNRECPSNERCECDEAAGCFCILGARGEGALGAACASGNDCQSALCLEGPGGALMCSIECSASEDCGGDLPLCADIAFVGRICVRSGA